MRVTGRTTRLTAMVPTSIQKELVMKESGRMINSMGEALKSGTKDLSTKDFMSWARKRAWESTHGLMDPLMRANGLTIKSTEKACIYGKTAANTTDSGLIMTWKDTECISGLTEDATKGSIQMTRNAAMASTIGLMEEGTRAGGTKVNNMASVSILIQAKKK